MSDSLDKAVRIGIGVSIVACAAAAFELPASPLAPSARAKWSAGGAAFRHTANRTYTIDATTVAGRERAYARSPLSARAGAGLAIRGWAFDPTARRSADRLVYRVDGGAWRDAAYHMPRPDVAAALGLPGLVDTGFRAQLPARVLTPGTHRVALATVTTGVIMPIPDVVTVVITAR